MVRVETKNEQGSWSAKVIVFHNGNPDMGIPSMEMEIASSGGCDSKEQAEKEARGAACTEVCLA